MKLSKFQQEILNQLYNEPYIRYDSLEAQHTNKSRLKNSILFFKSMGLIRYSPFNSYETDTGEVFTELESVAHIILTETGYAIIDERRKNLRDFLVPYTITTLIAISSLIISVIALFM